MIWFYELTPNKSFTKANPITDEDLRDCFDKWEKKIQSKNSWFLSIEEIVKNAYDLTAKNVVADRDLERSVPIDLVNTILEEEKKIQEIIEELRSTLEDHASK